MYVKKNTRHMPNPQWGIVKLYNTRFHKFPIGLLARVSELVSISNDSYITQDKVPLDLDFGTLRYYQRDALDMMFQVKNGVVKMPTGSGKTRLAVQFIKNFKKSTLILVPTLDLVTQWKKQVPPYVHVKTYAAISKKAYVQQFDCVIFDECHHCAAKTLYKIGMNTRADARVYGLSATPFSRDDDNMKVEAVLGSIIYEISTRDLIDKGYLCDAKVHYHPISPLMMFGFGKYHEIYDEYIVQNHERNTKILDIAKSCAKPCLILVNRIEHGEKLFESLECWDGKFLYGNMKKEDREDINHDILIATSIFDEGVDLPVLKTLIIAAGGKSAIKTTQRIGRLLRPSKDKKFAVIHDFKDDCRWLDKHYMARRKIIEQTYEVFDDSE